MEKPPQDAGQEHKYLHQAECPERSLLVSDEAVPSPNNPVVPSLVWRPFGPIWNGSQSRMAICMAVMQSGPVIAMWMAEHGKSAS